MTTRAPTTTPPDAEFVPPPREEMKPGSHHVALFDGACRVRYARVPARSGVSWERLPPSWAPAVRDDGCRVRVNGRLVAVWLHRGEARASKS